MNRKQLCYGAFSGLLILTLVFSGCTPRETPTENVSRVNHPQWSIHANIYEVNVRQFTPEGTFEAFATHLDRLQEMGVDILWFMPVSPIGEKNRKGSLGSYYSVKDYTAINPEFGTMEEFRALVKDIHSRGMYVIIDWVANHTAWDHPWTITNPDFYTRDENGNFVPPVEDWSDVIDLNYDNPAVWDAMIAEMRFWIEDVGIDGFRCDVAEMVPTEFWNRARKELEQIKPIYMLAEAEGPELHLYAFESAYGWRFHHIMNRIASGEVDVSEIDRYFFEDFAGEFPEGSYKMYFITNHDENSWAGTEFDRLGEGVEAFAVLSATIPGTVLLYSGQEAGFNRMLAFFEKDQIDWNGFRYHDFYRKLLHLKKRNQALWNGRFGGDISRILTGNDLNIFAFTREKNDDKVLVVLNLSGETTDLMFETSGLDGEWMELFSGNKCRFPDHFTLQMKPWEYRVYERLK